MHRSTGAKDDKRQKGLFHELDAILSHTSVKVAMKNMPLHRERNNKDLELQATAWRVKEEMAGENNIDNATGEHIEALYLICMYSSGACVKGNPRGVK